MENNSVLIVIMTRNALITKQLKGVSSTVLIVCIIVNYRVPNWDKQRINKL